jgi:crossover junction endodeoxyribonuclease RuvC
MRILGIDPGSNLCGYGVIEYTENKLTLIEYGVIDSKRFDKDLNGKIYNIFNRICEVINQFRPETIAIESTFHAKNSQSLIKLTSARAAAILACKSLNLNVNEYSPREVKKSVTGSGASQKEQVRFMVAKLLSMEFAPDSIDASDALSIAICQAFRSSAPTSKAKSWKEFIANNPERVRKS